MRAVFPWRISLPFGNSLVKYPKGISPKNRIQDDAAMTKLEARQAWVRGIIDRECGGNKAAFARRIGKSDSYVNRMLFPKGKPNAKGIGDEIMQAVVEAFPTAGLPLGDLHAAPERGLQPTASEQRDNDILALQMTMESLVKSVSENLPAAGAAFDGHLRARAREESFSTRAGLLASVLKIAAQGHHTTEVSPAPAKIAGSRGK